MDEQSEKFWKLFNDNLKKNEELGEILKKGIDKMIDTNKGLVKILNNIFN